MSSGWLPSASLPASTEPAIGAYTSEAAFTDSTTAKASPALSALPASGTSTNTRSPSAPCAWSVMPTSTLPSASVRTHSCDFVYLRSGGMLLMNCSAKVGLTNQYLAVAHERRFDHARVQQLAAH